ncbi:MAG: hypothetical protein H8E33_00395 [Candidatus Cloacimonetes bacterium]|nr:hypothetical protein [Candidatus Cloacimonadota bacterium]MBL7108248.1 hypothetical protein [Candidatus Cloacimonadota bacterium]
MAKKKKYVYEAEKFCVPVTKISPLESIQFVIDDFKKRKVTFCVDGNEERSEIWRIEENGDSDKIKKKNFPKKPKHLYVKGKEVEYKIK